MKLKTFTDVFYSKVYGDYREWLYDGEIEEVLFVNIFFSKELYHIAVTYR